MGHPDDMLTSIFGFYSFVLHTCLEALIGIYFRLYYSSITVNDVLGALKDIKLGKHDGKYSLTSDHVVNSRSRFFLVILSILMSSMLVHGYNATDLLSSTIISIPERCSQRHASKRQLQRNIAV